jgi:dTDP-4-dehydrorhamnose reductase
LGSTGTLGNALSRICEQRNIHHISLNRKELDVNNTEALEKLIKQHQPWAIVNAAGYVKVDEAENEPDTCIYVNGEAAAQIAAVCAKYGIRFITYSTDLVFDGKKNSAYIESDKINPLNAYGKSKAIAEDKILECNPDALILRTSSFFGPWDKYNFVYHVLERLEQGNSVSAANDIFISPTYVPDLANESLDLLLDGCTGIFHVTNQGQLSWSDFAKMVADYAGYDSNLITGVTTNQLNYSAKRPKNSVLISERGVILPYLEDALNRYLDITGLRYKETLIAV